MEVAKSFKLVTKVTETSFVTIFDLDHPRFYKQKNTSLMIFGKLYSLNKLGGIQFLG